MKILYGVVGEGMGHAMRSRVVLEHLVSQGHEIEIMASGRATDFLSKRFEGVNRIHGLHMIYEENRVRRGKTLWSNVLTGAAGVPKNIQAYFELIKGFKPEVVVSDFESWTYLYAKLNRPPIRKQETSLYPPILRPEILAARRRAGQHLLVYQTAEGNDGLADTLAKTGLECRIYGMRRDI